MQVKTKAAKGSDKTENCRNQHEDPSEEQLKPR